jgi:hypothetical protein
MSAALRRWWSLAAVLALLLASPSVAGSAVITATRLTGAFPASVAPDTPFTFTVTALDASGRPASSYEGDLHFESSDPSANLPEDLHMIGNSATFTATLGSLGTQTIAVTDMLRGQPFEAMASISVVRMATQIELVGPASTVVGLPALVSLRALDASGELVTGYAGTVHLTSSDAHAELPEDVGLVRGQASVLATFATPGPQTISAADEAVLTIAGRSAPVVVGFVPLPPAPPGDEDAEPPDGGDAPPPPRGGSAPAPVVRGLAVRPLCVRRAKLLSAPKRGRGKLALSFTLSAGARVSVSVGRLVRAAAPARCPKRAGSAKGAVKLVRTLSGPAAGGANALAVAAGVGHGALPRAGVGDGVLSRAGVGDGVLPRAGVGDGVVLGAGARRGVLLGAGARLPRADARRRTVALAGSAAAAKALAPGAYVVQVRATDAAGRRSALATAKFFVLR